MPKGKKLTPEQIEESERELVFQNEQYPNRDKSHWFKSQIVAKVSKKTFKLGSRHNSNGAELTIEKRVWEHRDMLSITTVHKPTHIEKCNFGHEHEVQSKEEKWDFFTLPWSQVESLIDWLRTGTYREVKGKVTPEQKLLVESFKFCEMVEKDAMLAPHAKKLKTKISKYLCMGRNGQENEQLPVSAKQVDLRDEKPLDLL